MHAGQTRAALARKTRAGVHADILRREKRMGDLAWQMNVARLKLNSFPKKSEVGKTRLEQLFAEAKVEFERLQFEANIDEVAKEYGVYLG